MSEWRNRIVKSELVDVDQLLANESNYRIHSRDQQEAVQEILDDVGIVKSLLINLRTSEEWPPNERGVETLVDGHLRAQLALSSGQAQVQAEFVDLTPDEEADVLLKLDASSAYGVGADKELLTGLLHKAQAKTSNAAVKGMLQELAGKYGIGIDSEYTDKIVAPVYTPKGDKPPTLDLIDREKTEQLLEEIDAGDLPEDVARFLRFAAERHTVFNFRKIAEFYCHMDEKVQDLMERSGLVIIDFDKAIECGFVRLTEQLEALAGIEAAPNAG